MIGIRVNSTTPGRGEVDWLKGDRDADVFVLGDAFGPYYNDGRDHTIGIRDMAIIRDFRRKDGDVIRLHGSKGLYQLRASRKGTAIVYTGGTSSEQIGLVQRANGLSLSSSDFEYVMELN